MFANNPYAQGGWFNPQNPTSINGGTWRHNPALPPTFGALPPPEPSPSSLLTFEFAGSPDVLNCTVVGPGGNKFFEIRTSGAMTTIMKPGAELGVISWQRHPLLDFPALGLRKAAGEMVRISSDHSFRMMSVSTKLYVWIPRSSGIYLYSTGPSVACQLARISVSSGSRTVRLEITSEAFQAGLFEPSVISVVLLCSGRSID